MPWQIARAASRAGILAATHRQVIRNRCCTADGSWYVGENRSSVAEKSA
jgi:hypothetical protein